jgi:hypothetical protein
MVGARSLQLGFYPAPTSDIRPPGSRTERFDLDVGWLHFLGSKRTVAAGCAIR